MKLPTSDIKWHHVHQRQIGWAPAIVFTIAFWSCFALVALSVMEAAK